MINCISIKFYGTLFLIITSIISYSQDEYDTIVVRDIESWHNAQIEYKINKKLSVGLTQHVRFVKNSSNFDRALTDLKLEYNILKGLKIAGTYRYMFEQKKTDLSRGHRWNIDASYSYKFDRLKLSSRVRYQSKIEFPTEENSKSNHIRLRLKAAYNIKNWKLDPYITNEIFKPTNNALDNKWDNYRITVGTQYNFNKHHRISLFYGAERDLNNNYPKTTYLLGVGYKYTLKNKKND